MKTLYSILALSPLLLSASAATNTATTANLTCESSFSVKSCSSCQTTLFSMGQITDLNSTIGKCNIKNQFLSLASGDGYTQKANDPQTSLVVGELQKFCNQNPCPESTATQLYNKILSSCGNELNANYTPAELYFLTAYLAVPNYQALCIPDTSNNGYCFTTVVKDVFDYAQNVTQSSNAGPSVGLLPPDGKISYSNGTNNVTKVAPNSIFCSDCYLKITNNYLTWITSNPVNNVTTGFSDPSKARNQLTQTCGSNSLNVVDNSTSSSSSSTSSGSSGGTNTGTTPSMPNSATKVAMPLLSWGLVGAFVLGALAVF